MTSQDIRQAFFNLLAESGHSHWPAAPLLPEGDASVLFTVAGMQQFKDYYAKPALAPHCRLATAQPVIRTIDIDEVGDNRHLTIFEMLGYFSFGYRSGTAEALDSNTPYFKRTAIELAYNFFFKRLNIAIERSYVTVYQGKEGVPADHESAEIWVSLGYPKDRIRFEGEDNFWALGVGSPCGPTTEIYVDEIEVGNVVFNQYLMTGENQLEPLTELGVDTGLGLERIALVMQQVSDVYATDLLAPIVNKLQALAQITGQPTEEQQLKLRIIADHLKASAFLINDGVRPSNKTQGYILRRLLRRLGLASLKLKLTTADLLAALEPILDIYAGTGSLALDYGNICLVIEEELKRFARTLELGQAELTRLLKNQPPTDRKLATAAAFQLYDTFGLPYEVIESLAEEHGLTTDKAAFEERFATHQATSRQLSQAAFVGGLADHQPATIAHHTAHHLLLAALQQLLGPETKQRGSNVTSERLRLDFNADHKLTAEELAKLETQVNQWIEADLPVNQQQIAKTEAEKLGAQAEFGAKYGDIVSVYAIGTDARPISLEFCGGPHVQSTGQLAEFGHFKILKEEASSAGIRRLKAKLLKLA